MKNDVSSLMDDISQLDTEVEIYKVFVVKNSFTTGFNAWVMFRSWGQDIDRIETHGDTVEDALTKLKSGLLEKFMSKKYYMEIANGS